jgi:hypothetical protein
MAHIYAPLVQNNMTNQQLRDLLDTHPDLSRIADHIPEDDQEITRDEAQEILDEAINEEEIIYYTNAMAYLRENDASLQESLSLASDMGFELKNLNSEMLATLLWQQNLHEELSTLVNDIF